jgi:hypothetical protein
MNVHDIIGNAADIATSIGVVFAGYQLWLTQKQALTSFEDQLTRQYREIVRKLPIGVMLGDNLTDAETVEALPIFYDYFDLCNEQAFLYEKKRVRPSTWADWREGMVAHLQKPSFAQAWQMIESRSPETFDEFRWLVMAPSEGRLIASGVSVL